VETQTARPSARHVWQHGYWRWSGREYTWSAGYWEEEGVTAPHAPPAVRYEDPGYAPSSAYFYAPGYWRWGGREYVWMGGHWSHNSHASYYYRPRWESSGGRWGYRVDRWDRVPRTEWYHDRWDYRARGDFDRRGHAFDHRGHDVKRRDEHRGHGDDHRGHSEPTRGAPATRGGHR
jgi:hypothetical protein